MSVYTPADIDPDHLKDYALDILDEVHKQQESLRFHRVRYMQLARQYGASHREIGERLGVTPHAVMHALKRARESAL